MVEAELLEQSAKGRFTSLDSDRTPTLDRAVACSELTIPSVLPDVEHTEDDKLNTPFQGLGARLVNSLSSKLLLTLLPPNTSFFRLLLDEDKKQEIGEEYSDEAEAQIIQLEQALLREIERNAIRVPIFEAVKSLVVTGNSLVVKVDDGVKVYKLNNYVIQRDYRGHPIEIVTKEIVVKETLPDYILSELGDEIKSGTDIEVYTRAVLTDEGKWLEYQTVEDVLVNNSKSNYGKDKLPYIPLRWSSINGENYGRGLVEQYLGDFRSLEALYQLLLETSAVQARTIFGKRPGATLDVEELNNAENGAFVFGDLEQDISVLRVQKGMDLQSPYNMVQDLTRRLEQAFLVASSVTREAERVTALEIRYMASDLEQSLGGVYSVLSLELQRPLAQLLLDDVKLNLKELGLDVVIVTGIEALGRNAELDKLRQFNALLKESGLGDAIAQKMNIDNYINDITNALSLPSGRYVKSDQQLQQEQQAQQEQQLMMQGAQGMVDGAVNQTMQPQPQQQ